MGTTRQTAKRDRQSKELRIKNREVKTRIKNALKAYDAESDVDKKQEQSRSISSLLDKAGQDHVMHPRKAARRKSNLAKAINRLKVESAPESTS